MATESPGFVQDKIRLWFDQYHTTSEAHRKMRAAIVAWESEQAELDRRAKVVNDLVKPYGAMLLSIPSAEVKIVATWSQPIASIDRANFTIFNRDGSQR